MRLFIQIMLSGLKYLFQLYAQFYEMNHVMQYYKYYLKIYKKYIHIYASSL